MTTRETNQLIESVFETLKDDASRNFESLFKQAYERAVSRMNLKHRYQSDNVFKIVKAEVEKRLERYAEEADRASRLPNYFKFHRSVPLLDCEKFALDSSC